MTVYDYLNLVQYAHVSDRRHTIGFGIHCGPFVFNCATTHATNALHSGKIGLLLGSLLCSLGDLEEKARFQ